MSDYDGTDHYQGALLEEIRDDVQRLAESMAGIPEDVRELKKDMTEVKADIKTIKKVVTAQSSVLNDHERRVIRLEKSVS